MNYVISFAICIAGTVMAALTASRDLHWLITSDMNVAIWLFIAWALDQRRG